MKAFTRADIAALTLKVEPVEVPEVDGKFFVRELNGAERDDLEEQSLKVNVVDGKDGKRSVTTTMNQHRYRARLVARCLVDESGARLYSDDEVDACAQEFPAAVLAQLHVAAQKLNGMSADATDKAAKNS